MSETNDTADKPKQGRKPLSLQRTVESGHVQQRFGQGRSKSVVVEKKKKRSVMAPAKPAAVSAPAAEPDKTAASKGRPKRAASASGGARPGGAGDRGPASAGGLSKNEMAARAAALAAAHLKAAEDERLAEQRRVEEEAQAKLHAEEAARQAEQAKRDAEAAKRREAEAAASGGSDGASSAPAPAAPEEAAPPATASTVDAAEPAAQPVAERDTAPAARDGERSTRTARPAAASRGAAGAGSSDGETQRPPRRVAPSAAERAAANEPMLKQPVGMTRPMIVTRADRPEPKAPQPKGEVERARRQVRPVATEEPLRDDEESRNKRKAGGKATRGPGRDDGRVRGKLTIANAFDERQRERSLASLKRKRERERQKAMGGVPVQREKITREVVIPEAITIQELANRMTERSVDVIKYLMQQGAMHKINDVIDADTAELITTEFGHTPKRVSEADVEEGFFRADSDEDTDALLPRAPVVTIMGHVDHGKTSLLDAIREAKVASGEAGGITQHIGAYQVETDNGNLITFIDTPGHEAFTAMRARGAKVTDIVILVVAADDGVMPQTVEAIHHAHAAKVPMIVAINKIDSPAADPQRVRTELLQHGVVVESMSGETLDVEVSALKKTNLDGLLEAITLQSELLDLRANPDRSAEGFVIEAKLERGRGPVGTLLVQRGTLGVGDIVVAGTSWGRVRALIDDHGDNIGDAEPSMPVEVLGFDSAPEAGDQFAVVENEARAREITAYRERKRRETLGQAGSARSLEQMMQQLHEAGQKEFPLVIKGDVQGSIEAITGALQKISTDEVQARLVHTGVGGITESDISLAVASDAICVGFNVRANVQAKAAADRDGVEIRYYNIIYDLVDDVKSAMSGMLDPTLREHFLGNAEIREVFNISKMGKVAGCLVTDGRVERGAKVRLIRDNVVIHEGTLSTLKRFKDEVKEVPAGQECGMAFANYEDIRKGDVIECFQVEVIQRTLDD